MSTAEVATPLEAALRYARRGWPVFPCNSAAGRNCKTPMTPHGFHDATTDGGKVANWWSRWPTALVGVATGEPIGCAVLDIDVRHEDGFRTLDELDGPIRPSTPTVHTPSGGLHLYFALPAGGLRNTGGARGQGIGPGLDWRGDGGYVIVPCPASGYRWGNWHFDNCEPVRVPPRLLPRLKLVSNTEKPAQRFPQSMGLSRYAEAALDAAARAIIVAPAGEQEMTLNGECFSIGTLAGAGAIPANFARKVLLWTARQMRDHDRRRPWIAGDVEFKVTRAFNDGMRHPRGDSHAA